MKNENSHYQKSRSGHQWPWIRISLAAAFFPTIWLLNDRFSYPAAQPLKHISSTFNKIKAPKANVWRDLSDDEFSQLLKFLHEVPNDLNLTISANATSWDNTISLTEILRPNKTTSLPYLLNGTESAPARWARVVVEEGAMEANSQEYMVGPLPITSESQILPLTFCYNSGRSYTRRIFSDRSGPLAQEFLLPQIKDIVDALTDGDLGHDDLTLTATPPRVEDGRLIMWAFVVREGSTGALARTLLPQGLHLRLDITGRDPEKWTMHEWFYNGIMYSSGDELREEMKKPGFERAPLNSDGDWTNMEDYSPGTPGREYPGPMMVLASPPRYGVDMQQKFISWMGFEFYISFAQMTGISLYDIRFKGERIAYEIGLQEALAHYAGDDPQSGRMAILDTSYSMGSVMFELVPGYDCPAYATFMDTSFYNGEKLEVRKNSICLFEYTADYPLQRHTEESYVSISRNTYFVVRSTSVMGNYDYQFDYIFYLDGSIEVKVRASGFIEGAYWSAGQSRDYGYRAHDQFQTRMHDHVLNFKADLDIAGTENTLVRLGIEPASLDYEYDSVHPRNTMRLTKKAVMKETGLNWAPNAAEKFVLLNAASKNAWGEQRGFEVRPGTGMGATAHLTVINSTVMRSAIDWARNDIFITRQKDTEPRSASSENYRHVEDPLVNFGKFLDDEDTVQEDLVVWFNLGTHHVPHSGDLPNTLMHTSASAIMFTPHNFHDMDPSRASRQGVRLDLANRENTTYFGGRHEKDLHIKLDQFEPDLKNDYNAERHVGKKWLMDDWKWW